ncbi:hypothetical protein RI129_007326 [Pyrocoelia pectoralis]|uniref:Uncharacterized protein n=1 Tax=Pyrocoelia pectoralis TaxID=417401 RepID=A0AAN7VDE4_9COLE
MDSFSIWTILLLSTGCVTPTPTTELTTRRPTQAQIGETIKQLADQLIHINSNSTDTTLDTRTPPKVKQQIKKPPKKEQVTEEHSHPGVVEPVLNLDAAWEENTKKLNFYKLDTKFTTERGLSTWVLLNSQTVSPPTVSTTKSTPKPIIKQKFDDNRNLSRTEIFNKITKPLFKKRPATTTTKKPSASTTTTTTEPKLTKIKASILNDAINNKNKTVNKNEPENNVNSSSTAKFPSTTTPSDSLLLSIEPKDDEVELLLTPPSKKNRRPSNTTKKKKNKTRRRRPAMDKSSLSNNTKLVQKEKPIGTQIYNYLSREIMPTVGVGLVGLMVTAGLASYFLYPFAPVRRSYQVDRKDKESTYFYNDEYTPGGITEEEAIGKVIAGMPTTLDSHTYRGNHKSGYQNVNRKSNEFGLRRGQSEASVEAIYLTPSKKYDNHQSYFSYRGKQPEIYNSQDYVTDRNKLHPEVTPLVVPEHGPRNLPKSTTTSDIVEMVVKARKRRSSDLDNDIFSNDDEDIRQTKPAVVESATLTTTVPNKPQNFLHTLRILLESQIKIGLEFLEKTSMAIAKYFSNVHSRFNDKLSKEQPRMH